MILSLVFVVCYVSGKVVSFGDSMRNVVNVDDGNWWQAEAWIVLLAGPVEVNTLAQGALRQFTQWLWIEHLTFQLRGGHFTTELFAV